MDADLTVISEGSRIRWRDEDDMDARANGTLVTVRCEDVPPGIRPEDHQAGLNSTLSNLAEFAERTA